MVLLFIIVLRLVFSHYLCGGSWTSSGEGGVPENEVLRFTEGEGTIVWTRVVFIYVPPLLRNVEQSHSESVASLPLDGQSEEESLAYSVQEAQESGHSDPPAGGHEEFP